jgi:hypothetical protein
MAYIIITKSLLMYDMDGIDKISFQHLDFALSWHHFRIPFSRMSAR